MGAKMRAKPITEVKTKAAAARLIKQRADQKGNLPIEDVVEASIMAMFFIQKLGKVSQFQIAEKIAASGGRLNEDLLLQSIEALQARGLVSYATGTDATTKERVRMWKPRQAIWASPPEVAHITELMPALVATKECQALIDLFNEGEKKGEGEQKARRSLGYDKYYEVEATFRTVDEMLGSQPSSPWLQTIVKKSRYNGIDNADLRFWRDAETGELIIGADAARAYIRDGLRTAGYAESIARYLAVDPVRIKPQKPLKQVILPVVDSGGGRGRGKGLPSYEGLQPGEQITLKVRAPLRGFMSPKRFMVWLMGYAMRPLHGLSPARGGRFGRMEMTAYRVIGECRSGKTFVGSVVPDLRSEDAKSFYADVMATLEAGDEDLRRKEK
jgi:hypothetical protein